MSHTTKQRNKIYKEALAKLPETNTVNKRAAYSYSICRALYFTGKTGAIAVVYVDLKVFEELFLFRPKRKKDYWLPDKDLQTRQIILDFCILMTETK